MRVGVAVCLLLLSVPVLSGCLDGAAPEESACIATTCGEELAQAAPPEPEPLNETESDPSPSPGSPKTLCERGDCRLVSDDCACWEPTVAVLDGEAWVLPANEDRVWVETEDGWRTVDLPVGSSQRGDGIVQVFDGVLYYSALEVEDGRVVGTRVARWGGDGWAWDTRVPVPGYESTQCTVPVLLCSTTTREASMDRQWLLARGDEQFLFFQSPRNYPAPFVAVGRDGSFEPAEPLTAAGHTAINGRPVDVEGTIVWPMFLLRDGALDLVVFRSVDGRAWEQTTVVAHDGANVGQWFPAVAAVDETVLVSYRDMDDRLLVVRSDDAGATWGTPSVWDEAPGVASPWLEASDSHLVLTWFRDTQPATLWMAVLTPEGPLADAGVAQAPLLLDSGADDEGSARTHTHFAHAVVDEDGGFWWTWASDDRGRLGLGGPL